uniref:PCNA-interacting partner n=1 Tax=Meleagris gallopavo TaxID=9103 RepID=A0A803Y7K1_MELGA
QNVNVYLLIKACLFLFIEHFRNLSQLKTILSGVFSMTSKLMSEQQFIHHGDFAVSLSDVMETWKYLLHDKLGLLYENMEEPENYADFKKAYHTFLASSNMLDIIDIYQKSPELFTSYLLFLCGKQVCLNY